ncbi:hypothetical protein P170DRAFT_387496, partial [Aspergillus steynii IBT 23096]
MSGLLEDVPTPCPSRLGASRVDRSSAGSDSIRSMWEDSLDSCEDTANIEFTTEIQASILTGAKPRRRTKTNSSSTFSIHDESEENHAPAANKRRRDNGTIAAPSNRKSSLLAQPAQRFRPKVSLPAASPAKPMRSQGEFGRTQTRKFDVDKNKELLMQINGNPQETRTDMVKDVHRDAVYVPPNEPTAASVFMGLFSPIKSDYLDRQSETTKHPNIARKRHTKPSLASSAHRAPLQPSAKISQESRIHIDVVGKNGGKENIPPGTILVDGKEKKFPSAKFGETHDNASKPHKRAANNEMRAPTRPAVRPLAAKSANGSLQRAMNNVKTSSAKAGLKDIVKPKMNTARRPLAASTGSTLSSSLKQSKGSIAGSRTTAARTTAARANAKKLDCEYPLIQEEIKNPALYEDNWLSHQEIVITQLVNGLFESTESSTFSDPGAQRHSLLALYQDPSFAQLYKRVQASLLYGALSIPRDVLARTTRLKRDLGMKRKFLDFWLNTYDLGILRAGLETITGRRIANSKMMQESTAGSEDSSLKRKMEKFLDTFLLQNQDMDRDSKEPDSKLLSKAYHRTVFRSIMLIILLDKAATESGAKLPRLFLSTSPHKSSAAVLQALARFLLPSSGDVVKALNHLDCHLTYEQHPLQEYEYRISNLAVDLRDGVRLTRIVELLLFPSAAREHPWPLSQNLKFPCLSRAVKGFNVEVALNAIASSRSSRGLLSNVRAEDIVNGHREKTISLLWGLVSKWGLVELINWNDLSDEIHRLKLKASQQFGHQSLTQDWFQEFDATDESDGHVLLLKQWASILAHLKGLHLDNLSTSFGDGKIYESIVDEYEEYILHADPEPLTSGNPLSLQSRLRTLGCSAHFANLIHPSTSKHHILDSDFTIGALAFLCSRLLSASKRARAATVLQQRWRGILAHRDLQRRIVARDVARQCAAVVQTRERVIWATSVIVQWWRNMKAKPQRRNGRTSTFSS